MNSFARFIQTYLFDGINLDWEFPVEGGLTDLDPSTPNYPKAIHRPDDGKNFVLLVEALRSALTKQGPNPLNGTDYLLTMECSPLPAMSRHLMLTQMHPYLDFITLMCYDLRGPWSGLTGHHQPLYKSNQDRARGESASSVVSSYQRQFRIPSEKLILGLAFHCRSFGGVASSAPDGLFVNFDPRKTPKGSFGDNSGIIEYWDLVENVLADPFVVEHWDDKSGAPYAFNSATKTFYSYDNPKSVALKSEYVIANKLGGVMCWELGGDCHPKFSNDDVKPGWDLLNSISRLLNGASSAPHVPLTSHGRSMHQPPFVPSTSPIYTMAAVSAPVGNLMAAASSTKRVVAYYTNWSIYARQFFAPQIPIEKMTHLLYGKIFYRSTLTFSICKRQCRF